MKRVVIIGAGPAGLTAAYELLKSRNEYEVVILEQSNYIGGLAKSIYYNGHGIDIGGHKFKSKDSRVNDWWNEIMPTQGAPSEDDAALNRFVKINNNGPDPNTVDGVMLNRRASSKIYLNKNFFDYPIKMNQENFQKLGANASAKAGFSMLGGTIVKRKEKSVEDTYINRFGRFMYATFFQEYTEKLLGHTPNEVSTEWADVEPDYIYAPTIRGIRASKEADDSLNEEFCYPKYGPGYFWESVAVKITEMGGTIYKNCRVEKVNTEGFKVTGVTYVNNGTSNYFEADEVISTMPIKYMVREMDNIPANVQEVVHRLQYRDYVSVSVLVPSIKIKNSEGTKTLNNMAEDAYIYIQDKNCKMARVRICNNWSPYLVPDIYSSVWLSADFFCNAGDYYWNMSDQAWKELAISELKKVGIIDDAEVIMDSVKISEESVIPGYYESYDRIGEVIDYVNKFSNLYCIGRNGQHRVMNMDMAMRTAFEAVKNIENESPLKKNIWDASAPKENFLAEKKAQEEIRKSYKKERPVAYNSALLDMASEEEERKVVQVDPVPEIQPIASAQSVAEAVVEEPSLEMNIVEEPVAATELLVEEPAFEEEKTASEPMEIVKEDYVITPLERVIDNSGYEDAPALKKEPELTIEPQEVEITPENMVQTVVGQEVEREIVEPSILDIIPDAMDRSLAPKIDVVEEPKILQMFKRNKVVKESNVETVVVERPEVEIPIDISDEMLQSPIISSIDYSSIYDEPIEGATSPLIPMPEKEEESFMATEAPVKAYSSVDSIVASDVALRPQSERIVSFENMSEADAVEIWEKQTLNSATILTQEEALRMEMAKLQAQESAMKVELDPDATTVIKEEPSLIVKQEQKPLTPKPKPEPKKEVSPDVIAQAIANGKVIKSTKVRTSVSAAKKDGVAPRPIRDDDFAKKIVRRRDEL